MKNSEKGLASETRPRYGDHMEETWSDVPDLPGVEVSTSGRVRRWMSNAEGQAWPSVYRGTARGTTVVYRIDGDEHPIDELMRAAFGDEADEMEAGYDPRDRDRDLTQYEINEIRAAEGYKPAFKVAEDFRIENMRVRQIWDGSE